MRTYEIENTKTGERKDLFCNQRDLRQLIPKGWELAEVPSRIAVCPTGGPSQADSVLKGFYECEQKIGHSELIRQTGVKNFGLRNASDVIKCWKGER